MRRNQRSIAFAGVIIAVLIVGCAEKKTTRKVEVEGPDKKYEVKVEKTEKK